MKKSIVRVVKVLFVLLLFPLNAVAQVMNTPGAQMSHDLADSKLIHAAEVTLQPGEKTAMHTHPAHFYYALTDGKMMVHYQDGKDQLYEMKAGESGVGDPERPHISENVGTAPLKFLIVELKEHPYKAEKKKK